MRVLSIAFFLIISQVLPGQGIGIGTTTPHASAKLHIEDNAKGLLIPRMSTIDRDAIANPAEGLLVYDYNLKSIMLYKNDAWFTILDPLSIPDNSLIEDDDSDTKVDVEENPDEDMIRFQIAGNERMILTDKGLELKSPGFSVHIGEFAGEMDDGTNNSNVFVGQNAGRLNTSGQENVALGRRAGQLMETGNANVYLGYNAGKSDTSGSHNVFIGHKAGADVQDGEYNVFIGSGVGQEAEVDSQLRIHHKTSEFPLIHGDFGSRDLKINGDVVVEDTLFANNGSILLGETNINNAYSLPQNNGIFNQVLKVGFGGNLMWSTDAVNDADNDPTNEIETWSTLSGIPVGFQDNIDNVVDADASSINELQTLSLAGDLLTISDGNTIDLSSTGGSSGTYIQDVDGVNIAKVEAEASPTTSKVTIEFDGQTRYGFFEDYIEFINDDNNSFLSQVPLNTSATNSVTLGELAGPCDKGVSIGSYAYQLTSPSDYAIIAIGDSSVRSGGSFNIGIGKNALMGLGDGQLGAYESIGIGFEAGQTSTGDGNIFMGHQAGLKVGSGRLNIAIGNTMVGTFATNNNEVTGELNIGLGFGCFDNLIGGDKNIALGSFSSFKMTGGNNNISLGEFALYENSTGSYNIAIGRRAGRYLSTGDNNVAIGDSALYNADDTNFNVAVGKRAMNTAKHATRNTAIGSFALETFGAWGDNPWISANTAIGYGAMQVASNSENGCFQNVAVGNGSMRNIGSGEDNVGVGYLAGFNCNLDDNVFIGSEAGHDMELYSESVIIGSEAAKNTVGALNTGAVAIGYRAAQNDLETNTVAIGNAAIFNGIGGANSTFVGANTLSLIGYDNQMALGYNTSVSTANTVRLGNASVSSIGGYANWTNVSDMRFKNDVRENVIGLDFIMGLRPVTYQLDRQAIANFNGQNHEVTEDDMRHSGFIAQEVEELTEELDYDFSGLAKPQNEKDHYGLKYAEFVVPLVQAVKDLKNLLEEKQSQINSLEARLAALEAKINE